MSRIFLIAGCLVFTAASMAHAQEPLLPTAPGPQSSAWQADPQPRTGFFTRSTMARNSAPEENPAQVGVSSGVAGQGAAAQQEPICGIGHLVRCIQDLGEDEKGIFTSPLRTTAKDAYWLAPLGVSTGLAFAYDADAAQAAGIDANRTNTANRVADFSSFFAAGAEGAGIYFVGLARKNPKLAETGRLSAEAIIDSGSVVLVTKLVTNRQRPRQGDGRGDFWPYGTDHWEWDSSFPSDHATASMSLARVIAGEYPHWYVMVPAYGFAEAVGISRILANQHFPSDVLVGQAVGFLAANYVLNHRSLYRPGAKKTLASRLIGSVSPIVDRRTNSLGASIKIPLGR